VEEDHGRHEEGYTAVIYAPDGLPPEWPDAAAVGPVGREREPGDERANLTTTPEQEVSLAGRTAQCPRLG
jgi:hypothetical protein